MQGVRVRATAGVAVVAVLGAAAIFAASASAAVIPVMNTNDAGANSLRDALTTANGTVAEDAIDIRTTGTISLTSAALPAIAGVTTGGKLTIQGRGAAFLKVRRAFAASGSVFVVAGDAGGGNATISGLTVENGNASGIQNRGTLKLDRVEVTGNSDSSSGGGIDSGPSASLTVDRSSVIGNTVTGPAGGGGIYNNSLSTLTITRSTISGNTASFADGGGIATFGAASSITGSTIAGNRVTPTVPANGANVYSQNGPLTIRDTLIADPLSSNAIPPSNCRQFGVALVSQGFNLADDASCAFSTPSDRPVVDPGLTGLAGAAPRVLPVAPGSPAADKIPGGSCATTTDERGVTRPQGGACEIGAYEIGPYEIEAFPPLPFRNTAPIAIPTVGAATPFPSQIAVSGLQGTVTGVSARIDGLIHSFPADIGALLVGPQGQTVKLLARNGGGTPLSGVTLTFDDSGSTLPTPLVSGTYKPSVGADPPFSAGAPARPFGTTFSSLNGTAPNGTWKLFVEDFNVGDSGTIARGWALDVRTTGPPVTSTPIPAPTKFCKVPNLAGKKAAAAQAQLTAAGCGTAKIVRKPVKKKKQRGKILSTNPAAGRTAAPGTAVKVTVGVKKKRKK